MKAIRTLRHVLRREWAQALALAPDAVASSSRGWWLPRAYYSLGMYATAADLEVSSGNCRHVMPMVVSLAACGRYEEARDFLRSVSWARISDKLKIALADALAPFMPVEALQMLRSVRTEVPPALEVALLLRTGDRIQALQTVRHAIHTGKAQHFPELHLYQTMAEPGTPVEQLQRLNVFLLAHNVPALALCNPDLPPSPCNVAVAQAFPYLDGPLVSVLMSTFRTGERASVAIESLLQQTYRNLEIIVVDDASGDVTPDLVADWTLKDSRVRLVRLPINGGTYLAKSVGLQLARGEFVTCHDSDDWSHPIKIERQVRPLLEDASLVATTSHWMRMQDDGVFYARPVHPLMRFNPSSPLFRREQVLQRMGAWDAVRTGADSEFYARLRLVFGRKAVRRIVQPLALGSHRDGSLMTASDTGYSDAGVSPQRLQYWESWSRWHLECLRQGALPRMPLDLEALASQRMFGAPVEIALNAEHVRSVRDAIRLQKDDVLS